MLKMKKQTRRKIAGALAGLVLTGCNSLPGVKLYNMNSIEHGTDKNGIEYVITGFDTNHDSYEDVQFFYIVREFATGKATTYLSHYAKDFNKDHQITENEWIKFYKSWWQRFF